MSAGVNTKFILPTRDLQLLRILKRNLKKEKIQKSKHVREKKVAIDNSRKLDSRPWNYYCAKGEKWLWSPPGYSLERLIRGEDPLCSRNHKVLKKNLLNYYTYIEYLLCAQCYTMYYNNDQGEILWTQNTYDSFIKCRYISNPWHLQN